MYVTPCGKADEKTAAAGAGRVASCPSFPGNGGGAGSVQGAQRCVLVGAALVNQHGDGVGIPRVQPLPPLGVDGNLHDDDFFVLW